MEQVAYVTTVQNVISSPCLLKVGVCGWLFGFIF